MREAIVSHIQNLLILIIELIEEREKTKKDLLKKHPGESVEEEEQRIRR